MSASHYVVLHSRLGQHFVAGEVVAHARLASATDDLARLVAIGAVRPATEAEAGMARITLAEAHRPLSFEMALADKVRQIADVEAQLAEARAEQLRLRSLAVPSVTVPSLDPVERVELRQAIDDLQRRLVVEQEARAALEAEVQALRVASGEGEDAPRRRR